MPADREFGRTPAERGRQETAERSEVLRQTGQETAERSEVLRQTGQETAERSEVLRQTGQETAERSEVLGPAARAKAAHTGGTRVSQGPLYWIGVLLVAGWGLVQMAPILWMVSTSLKPLNQVFALPIQWLPRPPQWSNYPEAWNQFPFGRYFTNSFIVSLCVTVLNVVLAGMAGYSLAKFRYFGQRALFVAVLSTLMLPIEVLMVPTFIIVKNLGWLNTYQGLIIPVVADAFGIFLMRQYMLSLPDSLVEAARIDGAGELGTYFRIVVPLTWPAVLTLAIFTWRETWDAFVWPYLIITDDALRTIPIGLQRFQEQYVTTYNSVMAVSTIAMIPMVLLFFFFQRAFIRGIALSGLKE